MNNQGSVSNPRYFIRRVPQVLGLAAAFTLVAGTVSFSTQFAVGTSAMPAPSISGDVWVAGHRAAHRINGETNQTTHTIPLPHEPDALAVDPRDQALWVLAHKTLLKFNAGTSLVLELDLHTLGKQHPGFDLDDARLHLNPHDGSVWIAGKRDLVHIDAQGNLLLAWRAPKSIEALALGLDETPWLVTKKALIQLSTAGSVLQQLELKKDFRNGPEHLAIDSLGGLAWVATEDGLLQINLLDPSQAPVAVRLAGSSEWLGGWDDHGGRHAKPQTLALNPFTGELWVAAKAELIKLDRAGNVLTTVDLRARKLKKPAAIAFEPASQSLWLAADENLVRFSSTGDVLATLNFGHREELEALGVAPGSVLPALTLLGPADGVLTNNPFFPIRLELAALCSGNPCDLGQGYFDTLSVNATSNDQAIGSGFQVNGNIATFMPTERFPEGVNRFTGFILDTFGHVSNTVTSKFTIDTIAPTFIDLKPPNGSFIFADQAIVSGSVDDPSATVILENLASLGGEVLDANPLSFRFRVPLQPGSNSFILTTIDPAGNQSERTHTLTRIVIPLVVTVLSPIDGEILRDAEVTVRGTIQGPPGTEVKVNGVVATVGADGNFTVANVALAEGPNTITVTAHAPDGRTTTQILSVTRDSAIPPDPASVAPPVDPTVATTVAAATSFLYSGANPIQTGVSPETIDPKRAAVIRGKVLARDNLPVPGVKITILNHPEYGQTLTRTNGEFDVAVNGGGVLTVRYEKTGYLTVQRQVNIPWQDYVVIDEVVMIQFDDAVTAIELTSSAPIQVAQGSIVSDDDGIRRATLLFPQGTTATMTLPDGTTQALNRISVRATEYSVGPNGPEAMPGELPPTSGYTYAVELSVDEAVAAGATRVQFNEPVPFYVENFLNFPVGGVVPVGYYDRNKATWISSNNGRVIKILGVINGLANLDIDGSGIPANASQLSELGVSEVEREQLAILYQPGVTLWRVTITHFTPWDCNWPFGPPPDSKPPEQPAPGGGDNDKEDEPDCQGGSIIECQNQILGESVDIVGTLFNLNYRSDRVPGRNAANRLEISLSGNTVPEGLKRIDLTISVAGQRFVQSFPATPNQSFAFTWDGKDAYGRPVQGVQPAIVRIGYVYDAVYRTPAQNDQAFATFSASGTSVIGDRARQEFILVQERRIAIGSWDARAQGLGSWTLDVHHAYDPVGQVLYRGDGSRRSANSIVSAADIVAGIPFARGFSGDGGPATQAQLNFPESVAVGPDGALYFADDNNHRIRRVGVDGTVTTVAGSGPFGASNGGFSGDGGPATEARLNNPLGIALGPDGSLYIADQINNRIRRVGTDGIITTVAGDGSPGFSGDGGPATAAQLLVPADVAVGPDGRVYIADLGNNRIRRLEPDGIVTTVVGPVSPAAPSPIPSPVGIALGPDGSLYIAVGRTNQIVRIRPDGIRTIAAGRGGTGFGGFSGDGGPAIDAQLGGPRGIAVGPDGSLYFAEVWNGRIRHVDPSGIITTVAGAGTSGSKFTGPSIGITLNVPFDVALGPDGALYIPIDGASIVVRTSLPLPGFNNSDIAVVSQDGRELYRFDANGRHLQTLNTLTGAIVYDFIYNANRLLVQIKDGDNNVTTIERDASGTPTAIIAPDGQRTTLTLDANGYLTSITNPANESDDFTYSNDGLLETVTNARGFTSRMTYDAQGRLLKDENAAAGSWTLSRTDFANGFDATTTSALGRTSRYKVENVLAGGRLRTNTLPDGTQETTFFNEDGSSVITATDGTITTFTEQPDPRFGMLAPLENITVKTPSGLTSVATASRSASLAIAQNLLSLTSQTDTVTINGKQWTTVYIAADKEAIMTSPVGRQTRTTVDTQGRPTKLTVSGLAPVEYSYDPRGRLVAVNQGSGAAQRSTSFAYNAEGNLDTLTDALNRTQHFAYDQAGRLTAQTLPDVREIRYTYDANGNITGITPPGKPSHGFQYTPVDLEEQYTPPTLTGLPNPATQYEYNLDKQFTKIIRPDGQTVALGYDAGGRLSQMMPSPAGGGIGVGGVNYAYHPTKGFLESITTADAETLTYTTDGVLVTGEAWGGSIAGQVTRGYNSDFQVIGLSVNGANITFGYDADGLPTQAGNLNITRNVQHGLITASTLGGVTTTQGYNSFGELIQFSSGFGSTDLYNFQFARDALGRITQKAETLPGELPSTYIYSYDQAGRLTTVTRDGTTVAQYVYDTNGNRLSKVTPSGTVTGIYDDQDRLLTYGNTTYTYTANGELKSKAISGQPSAISYDYDVFGNLRHVTLVDGTAIDYVIDGRNRRIGKKVNGTLALGFLYQDQLNPVAELDGAGNVVSRFVYGSRPNVPDYLIKNNQTYRIVADHLGSPKIIVNTQTGVVEQRIDYDEFGNILFDSNPGFQPFGFAGGLFDQHTGLIRFGARDYDPETGRWIAKDPIGFLGGDTNLFGYVLNDPINLIDPTGFSMVVIDINRDKSTRNSTIGNLSINGNHLGYTLEPPWRNNKTNVSSIPVGTYFGSVHVRPNGDIVIKINNVPKRSDVLIHAGNRPEDTRGCPLPGKTKANDFVGDSGKAMSELMGIVNRARKGDVVTGDVTDIIVRIR